MVTSEKLRRRAARGGSVARRDIRSAELRDPTFDVVVERGRSWSGPAQAFEAQRRTGRPWPRRRTRSTREHRPRAFVVRARAARARADEARPPAAPVPREVHPAARRGAARAATCRARRPRARPVRRLRHDARPVARERARRDRRRHRRLQLPAHARQDGARTTCSRSSTSCATRCARLEALDGARPPRPCATWTRGTRRRPRRELLVYRGADRRLRARRRAARRAHARGPLGAAHDALRPRLPARARRSASTGATSTRRPAARSSAPSTSFAATRSTRSSGSGFSRVRARGRSSEVVYMVTPASWSWAARSTASSRRRRTRA